MTDLEKWVLKEMVEHLKDMEGRTIYPCDLAFQIFESENCTGSYTCSAYESTQWIKEYFEDLGDAVEDYKNEFDIYIPKILSQAPKCFKCK